MKRLMPALLVIALIVWLVFTGITLQRVRGLLRQAGLPLSCVRGVTASESFTDRLCYTDGYDWAVLRVSPSAFTPPEGWEQGSAQFGEINPAPQGLGSCDFHPDFLRHAPLPEDYTAWRFIPRDESAPFDEQEWFAAMYDEETGMLVLYRGHTLYGSM